MYACPFCSHVKTDVRNTRAYSQGKHIRRRRVCRGCLARFSTIEITDTELIKLYHDAARRPPVETIADAVREVPIITVREIVPAEVLSLLDLAERALDPDEDYLDAEGARQKINNYLAKRKLK